MKTINIPFTDEEYKILVEAKWVTRSKNWHDFIMEIAAKVKQ